MAVANTNITLVKDLKPGMANLSLHVVALEVGRPNTTKDNQEVRTVKLADKSGMVNLSLWNEPGKVLQPGDIIRITRAYTGMFKSCLTVFTARHGEFFKVGEFCMLFSESPNMSEPNAEMAAQYEKDEFERKTAKANREAAMAAQGATGKSASGQPPPRTQSAVGSGSSSSKTWGTQGSQSVRGGTSTSLGNNGRSQHRGSSKEKR